MKYFFIFILSIILFSCSNSEQEAAERLRQEEFQRKTDLNNKISDLKNKISEQNEYLLKYQNELDKNNDLYHFYTSKVDEFIIKRDKANEFHFLRTDEEKANELNSIRDVIDGNQKNADNILPLILGNQKKIEETNLTIEKLKEELSNNLK